MANALDRRAREQRPEGFIIQRRCCSAEQARCRRHGPSLRCGSGSADVSPISLSGRTSRLSGLGDCKSEIRPASSARLRMLLLLTSACLAMQVTLPLDKGVVLLDVAFTDNDPNHGQYHELPQPLA